MRPLDPTDRRILGFLQEDAKLTNKEIATRLGMTTTPVYERIRRMEEDGYIQQYTVIVDREKLGYHLVAYCNVSLKEHAQQYLNKFEREVHHLREVQECYHVAGIYDYLLRVIVPDIQAYHDFIINKLAALENIGNVQSSFVMREIKWQAGLPLEFP